MMPLHSAASSSTFEAHPHHPQLLPNLNPMVGCPPGMKLSKRLDGTEG